MSLFPLRKNGAIKKMNVPFVFFKQVLELGKLAAVTDVQKTPARAAVGAAKAGAS